MPKRKTILYIAASLDGYIAKPDGSVDWLHDVEGDGGDNGYGAFYARIGTVVMGRSTYEEVLTLTDDFPYAGKPTYVLSRTPQPPSPHVQFTDEDVATLIPKLQQISEGDVWIVGGGKLVQTILEKDCWTRWKLPSSRKFWAMASPCSLWVPSPATGRWSARKRWDRSYQSGINRRQTRRGIPPFVGEYIRAALRPIHRSRGARSKARIFIQLKPIAHLFPGQLAHRFNLFALRVIPEQNEAVRRVLANKIEDFPVLMPQNQACADIVGRPGQPKYAVFRGIIDRKGAFGRISIGKGDLLSRRGPLICRNGFESSLHLLLQAIVQDDAFPVSRLTSSNDAPALRLA